MSLPAAIKQQIADLQTSFNKALPIESTPPLVYSALDNKAWLTLAAIDGQVAAVGAKLDGFAPGNSAVAMAAALTGAAQNAEDALDIFEARSFIGRFAANLELNQGYGKYFSTPAPLPIFSTVHAVLNFMSPQQTALVTMIF